MAGEELAQAVPFAEAFPDLMESIRRSRGRPPVASPKQAVTLRLDPETIAKFKAAISYSKDSVVGEYVNTVAATNMNYSFARACAAGVEAELSKAAAKS